MIQVVDINVKAQPDRIHVLPVSLLETHAEKVSEFRDISSKLGVAFGWHYPLDLAWCAEELLDVAGPGTTILDAGAGTGLMQWWLSNRGAEVLSIDRDPRHFTRRMRAWCPIVDYRTSTPISARTQLPSSLTSAIKQPRAGARRLGGVLRDLSRGEPTVAMRGTVHVLQADLRHLDGIETGSVDAVVSISSLEHNSPDNLEKVVAELMRVIRPGGKLIATLGTARDADWYHEASSGWCYTEQSLRRIFDLPPSAASNFGDFDVLFSQLVDCDYLKNNLSDFYFRSGNNGMPWGRWEPQYQSVGVIKTKAA